MPAQNGAPSAVGESGRKDAMKGAPASYPQRARDGRSEVVQAQREADRKARLPLVVTDSTKAQRLRDILRGSPAVDGDVQADRLLRALREVGPCTTYEARKYLDICAPAQRIADLRHRRGFDILTTFVAQISDAGIRHRGIAMYALVRGHSS